MIRFRFNLIKTTQATAEFLKRNDNQMNYMKLIKLLYLADRACLSLWERPITGDSYYSMTNGPILSEVLDLISAGDDPNNPSYWYKIISEQEHYEVKLICDPPNDELSKREIDIININDTKFKKYDQWDMVDYCHENLPEWQDPGRTSLPIRSEDILQVLDKTDIEISLIEDEIDTLNYAKKILSC